MVVVLWGRSLASRMENRRTQAGSMIHVAVVNGSYKFCSVFGQSTELLRIRNYTILEYIRNYRVLRPIRLSPNVYKKHRMSESSSDDARNIGRALDSMSPLLSVILLSNQPSFDPFSKASLSKYGRSTCHSHRHNHDKYSNI